MLLDDIETILVEAGETETSWPLYKAHLPDSPDQTISIFETGGYAAPDHYAVENASVSFQVRIRAAYRDYAVARQKWQDVFDVLHGTKRTSPFYCYIMALNDGPLSFPDEKGRPNLTVNFKVLKAR